MCCWHGIKNRRMALIQRCHGYRVLLRWQWEVRLCKRGRGLMVGLSLVGAVALVGIAPLPVRIAHVGRLHWKAWCWCHHCGTLHGGFIAPTTLFVVLIPVGAHRAWLIAPWVKRHRAFVVRDLAHYIAIPPKSFQVLRAVAVRGHVALLRSQGHPMGGCNPALWSGSPVPPSPPLRPAKPF